MLNTNHPFYIVKRLNDYNIINYILEILLDLTKHCICIK